MITLGDEGVTFYLMYLLMQLSDFMRKIRSELNVRLTSLNSVDGREKAFSVVAT